MDAPEVTGSQALFMEERRKAILDLLAKNSKVLVSDLSEQFGVTPATIRADLRALEDEGQLERTHGGAIALDAERKAEAKGITPRLALNRRQKTRIAAKAATYVNDGDFITVDSGSTGQYFVHALTEKRRLTILTTDIVIAHIAETEIPDVSVIIACGAIRNDYGCAIGTDTVEYLRKYYAPKLFVSTDALSLTRGLTTYNVEMAAIKRALLEQSETHILMADSSKVGVNAPVRFAGLSEVDVFVSDTSITPKARRAIEAMDGAPKLVLV